MPRLILLFIVILGFKPFSQAQKRPKLVVGIVVDQMRYDYLYKYINKYGNGGFKRLLNSGYSFEQCKINYVPSFTAPGHAGIYTGTVPSTHGIVSNEWMEKSIQQTMYCVSDSTVNTVGSNNTKAGKMSPVNLYTTTMTDELGMATNYQGKIIGVCIKDRGSILPAGHHPTAAYWFDNENGKFITSTYYTKQLPAWVEKFNNKNLPETLINKTWNTFYPIEKYIESTADDVRYEAPLSKKEDKPIFPHVLSSVRKEGYGTLLTTPFGNTLLKEFAMTVLKNENMGKDSITDFLAISFSSTDYVGHHYGIQSIELEDTYIRLDRELEDIFNQLDAQVGKGNYLVFLTADHGAAQNVNYNKDRNIPAGFFDTQKLKDTIQYYMNSFSQGADKWNYFYEDQHIYITVNGAPLPYGQATPEKLYPMIQAVRSLEGVEKLYTATDLNFHQLKSGLDLLFQNGYRYERSGDIIINLKSGWMEMPRETGTTHGSPYDYDTHIPFILMGWGIKQGKSFENVYMMDIAPTISSLLKIPNPSGCSGKSVYKP